MNEINNCELIDILIDMYSNIQRIINADDPKKEAEYQLKLIKAKLETMGIATTDFDINS